MSEMEIGIVISTPEGPNQDEFSFVVDEKAGSIPARKNQFVELSSAEGKVIAIISSVAKTNMYFERAESVREYERNSSMSSVFPTDRWEYIIASARILGVYSDGLLRRTSFPPSPGTKVSSAASATLTKFLGFSDSGLALGSVEYHDAPVNIDMTRLMQKHLAILSISGGGKSHFTSCLIEELLSRAKAKPALLVIDVHGEYTGFGLAPENGEKDYSADVTVVSGSDIRIGVPNMSARTFADFIPGMSAVQQRDLDRIITSLRNKKREEGKPYNLDDLLKAIEDDEAVKDNVAQALTAWIYELKHMHLFNHADYPPCDLIKPGKALVLDLSDIIYSKHRQVIVAYLSKKLFDLRRKGLVPPFVEIIEEAHQFIPEGAAKEYALARNILETIAREGRKFYASLCLISQRPVKLSTTVLSQCNTHIILRVTNPYDLKHIGESSEGITQSTLDTISSLRVGEALIVGEAVNFPVFVKVRQRNSRKPDHSSTFEEASGSYEDTFSAKKKDARAFM